ncbi:sugar ABC transporter ATP-binding protein [Nocardioides sp. SYSU D00038]|uniref:sugar ABC transporter ATP-binding protein n=1 Tax=Nocardioides sp. SYSU D00038 TaxID=2812554 RepID=UPI00196795EC|nr:sugar ABC transporter ATP-binding protein [Nocardioides sp. SYSU D00038]
MAELLLEASGVTKGFPGVQALSDMRLDLRHGEVLALVGENGAGKSTLMKLLSGVHSPDAGEFRLEGEPYRPADARTALASGVSIIHQEFNLMPHLTVAQNIFIGREPRRARVGLSERALNAQAGELLDRLGIRLDPRQGVGSLTVAKQQMVEIAKALAHEPKVLIMDEPTAALNDAEVETLHGLIRRFTTPRTGVIYISHRMDELKVISDRITVIRDGRFVRTVDTAATSVAEVVSLMVGRELVDEGRPVNVRDDREVVLSVRGLSTRSLLRDVSFDLRRGEILGFAGLMGAGRTEVARAIVGADRRTGRLELAGRPVTIRNPADAARLGIGYLSEDRKHLGLLLEQDVSTNIALPSLSERYSTAGWVRGRGIRAGAREMIARLRIKTPSENQTTKNLSGGNQQKVVIAKWLVKDCDILIFDEPTRGIDVGAKAEIYALLNELAESGKSIIMISSELPEVLRMSHRVVVMAEGRVSGVLDHHEATQESVMHLATLRPASADDPSVALAATPTSPPTPSPGEGATHA